MGSQKDHFRYERNDGWVGADPCYGRSQGCRQRYIQERRIVQSAGERDSIAQAHEARGISKDKLQSISEERFYGCIPQRTQCDLEAQPKLQCRPLGWYQCSCTHDCLMYLLPQFVYLFKIHLLFLVLFPYAGM